MADEKKVQIGEAKGRPMLHWVGKHPLDYVMAYPAQLVETFNPAGEESDAQGLLFHSDNKDALAWLLANGYRGKVDLVYIDPPFDSGADYVRRVELRGGFVPGKLEGEPHGLGEQIQYTDIWANDLYLQYMYERLILVYQLLSDRGSLYLHCDPGKGHLLRSLVDEIFGAEQFRAQIVWRRSTPKGNMTRNYGAAYDILLYFTKSDDFIWRQQFAPHSDEYVKQYYTNVEEDTGRRYQLTSLLSPAASRPNLTYEFHGHLRVWRYTQERMRQLEERGRVFVPENGGMPREKRYLDEMRGVPLQDWWDDIYPVNAMANEREDYPTQKPESLIERILSASSNPGDLVLDCFVGSGTAAAVAQKLGRRWIAADINKGAVQTTSKRLQTIIQENIETRNAPDQPTLDLDATDDEAPAPAPAALSFSIYRINDYDLQIQHNEAARLAAELTGIERSKTDAFFDGTLGKPLAKIIPFVHPLTPMDLQLVKDELDARPEEERDVVVVCLGKELPVDTWLEEYNKNRPINRIEVIELRTDEKYGKFFVHQPAEAQVAIERRDNKIVVDIEKFISPTIVERLEMDTPIFRTKIPDWRAMVDVVMIDTSYDGDVFDIVVSDVPERKDDLVSGHYELNAPDEPTIVAVKIVDMLGEEVLISKQV